MHKINTYIKSLLVLLVSFVLSTGIVNAASIKVGVVDNLSNTIYAGTMELSDTDDSDRTPFSALLKTGLPVKYQGSGNSIYVTSINNIKAKGMNGWMFSVNDKTPMVPAAEYTLEDGSTLIWYWTSSDTSKINWNINKEQQGESKPEDKVVEESKPGNKVVEDPVQKTEPKKGYSVNSKPSNTKDTVDSSDKQSTDNKEEQSENKQDNKESVEQPIERQENKELSEQKTNSTSDVLNYRNYSILMFGTCIVILIVLIHDIVERRKTK